MAEQKFIIGIDFGTTFTSVSYFFHDVGDAPPRAVAKDIYNIKNWPYDEMTGDRVQVPTEIWYSQERMVREPCLKRKDLEELVYPTTHHPLTTTSANASNTIKLLAEDDMDIDFDGYSDFLWGYEVHDRQYNLNISRAAESRITRPKLWLVKTSYTKKDRDELSKKIEDLIEKTIIRKQGRKDMPDQRDIHDVFTDFLVKVLQHTKAQLIAEHKFSDDYQVEFALTVPAIWSPSASRIFQIALQSAVQAVTFGNMKGQKSDKERRRLHTQRESLDDKRQQVNKDIRKLNEDRQEAAEEKKPLGKELRHSNQKMQKLKQIDEELQKLDEKGQQLDEDIQQLDEELQQVVIPYIVSEPEAAAAYMLADDNAIPDETFIIADCGGGTVDVTTYGVSHSQPVRLTEEKVKPGGDNCGSSYLNDNYKRHLLERLKDEDYFTEPLEAIVNRLMPAFENSHKRRIDVTQPVNKFVVSILGLKANPDKRFQQNKLIVTNNDLLQIWTPLLERVKKLIDDQLTAALQKGLTVKKIYLLGGFGGSPSLRSYLTHYLENFVNERNLNYSIALEYSKHSVAAVSAGAVLGALNKENGPDRISQSSIGWFRVEPYDPIRFPAHVGGTTVDCDIDGERYIEAVNYFILKGQKVSAKEKFKPLISRHTFELNRQPFRCEELIYLSDTATKSHYTLCHPNNKDAQMVGRILVDMNFLRKLTGKDKLKPIKPRNGVKHYEVEFELIAKVEGKELRYQVKWPVGENGTIRKEARISIAAAFSPGTE